MNRRHFRVESNCLLDILGHLRVYYPRGDKDTRCSFKRFITTEWRHYDFDLHHVKLVTRIEYLYNSSISIRHFIYFDLTVHENATRIVRINEQRYYITLDRGVNHGLDILFALKEFSLLRKYQNLQRKNRK